VLLTTGEGRFYSNGIDLEWLMSQGRDTAEKFFSLLVETMWRMMHFPLPTVAAINGKGGKY
jgi:enoyl-CoA hydratase/carnithine racemase